MADGLLVMPFSSTRYLGEVTIPTVREGLAGRSDFAVVPEVIVSVGEDDSAHEATRRLLAFYGSTPATGRCSNYTAGASCSPNSTQCQWQAAGN